MLHKLKTISKFWIKIAYFLFSAIYFGFSLILFYGGDILVGLPVFVFAIFLAVMAWRTGNVNFELHETYLKISGRDFPYKHITSITKTRQQKMLIFGLGLNPISNSWIYNINTHENTIEILDKFYLGVDNLISQVADKAKIRINTIQTSS